MAKTADVVYKQQIFAAWGNEIRDRTHQVFDSVAQRDSQWTSPPNGAFCVTLDTYTVWIRRSNMWVATGYDTWFTTWGLAAAPLAVTTNSAPLTTSFAAIAGLNITFTPVVGRRYKVLFETQVQSGQNSQTISVQLQTDPSTIIQAGNITPGLGGTPMQFSMSAFLSPGSANPVTITVYAKYSSGTAPIFAADANYVTRLWVEDVGPTSVNPTASTGYVGQRLPYTPVIRQAGNALTGSFNVFDLSRNGDRVNGEVEWQCSQTGFSGPLVLDWPNNWKPLNGLTSGYFYVGYSRRVPADLSAPTLGGCVATLNGISYVPQGGTFNGNPLSPNDRFLFQFSYLSTT